MSSSEIPDSQPQGNVAPNFPGTTIDLGIASYTIPGPDVSYNGVRTCSPTSMGEIVTASEKLRIIFGNLDAKSEIQRLADEKRATEIRQQLQDTMVEQSWWLDCSTTNGASGRAIGGETPSNSFNFLDKATGQAIKVDNFSDLPLCFDDIDRLKEFLQVTASERGEDLGFFCRRFVIYEPTEKDIGTERHRDAKAITISRPAFFNRSLEDTYREVRGYYQRMLKKALFDEEISCRPIIPPEPERFALTPVEPQSLTFKVPRAIFIH